MVTYIYALMKHTYITGSIVKTERVGWAYCKETLVPHRNRLNSIAPFAIIYTIYHYEFTPEHTPFELRQDEHINNVFA